MRTSRRTLTSIAAAALALGAGGVAASPATAQKQSVQQTHMYYWNDYNACHAGFLSAYEDVRAQGRRVLRNEGICQRAKQGPGATTPLFYVRLVSVPA